MAEGVGSYLQELRVARGLTTAQLARKAGVRRATLSEWQRDKRRPRLPELDAVLGALGVSEAQKQQAQERLRTPAQLQQLRTQAEYYAPKLESVAGHAPHGGDLLCAMRQRRGWTQGRLAQMTGVSQATVVRWERAEQWPGMEQLHRVCFLLGATEDELVALTVGRYALAADEEPLTDEEIRARLDYFYDLRIYPAENALAELRLLSMMAHAWRLAAKTRSGRHILAHVTATYADYLYLDLRFAECRAVSIRALDIYSDIYADCRIQSDGADRAVIRLAEATAKSGGRQGLDTAITQLEDWRTHLGDEKNDVLQSGWLLADLARFKALHGQVDEAVTLGRLALQKSTQAELGIERVFRSYDLAEVLLQAGRPQEVPELLGGAVHPHFRIVDARTHFQLGQYTEADTVLQEVLQWLDVHHYVNAMEVPYYRHEAQAVLEVVQAATQSRAAALSAETL